MKSAVETLSPTRVKLTVEVPFEELQPALDAAYKRIAGQISVPGFRKGKVPNRVIDQRVGRAAVLDEAINDAINVNLDAALRENEIKLLGRPQVDVTAFEDATPLAFTAEMDVVPEFELPAYDSIEVTVEVTTVRERVLPEADDAFAQLASEFDTIDELKADLRTRLAGVKTLEQGYAAREKVAEALLAATEVPIPEGAIAQQVEDHFADGHGDEAHRAEVETQTRDSLKSQLVLDKIAETEDLSVSEAELSSWLVSQAPRYGMSPDQFAQELVNAGQVPAAVAEVRRAKALAHVLEHATIVDSEGNSVDLGVLNPADLPVAYDEDDHEGHDHDDHEGHDHD